MTFERSRALSLGGFSRWSGFVLALPLCTTVGGPVRFALAAEPGEPAAAVQQRPAAEDRQADDGQHATQTSDPEPSVSPPPSRNSSAPSISPGSLCEPLARAAEDNDLPVDFFTRLIWHESGFRPDAISRAGAQGVAQFMPATAKFRGLADPFNPLEAIAKSAQLLRGLRGEFGNLGLAAAAYNGGSGRVRDWLAGRRPLPSETRAYVRLVTGRSVDDWAVGQVKPAEMRSVDIELCNLPANASIGGKPDASSRTPEPIKPWGVEVVGGPTPAKALARFREWQPAYAAIIADRKPHVAIRGIIGAMGAARVRIGEDTRGGAAALCAALRAAGTFCDVMRN